mmetsp:Transcript_26786/g.64511  ORF Transcript_26786/g.64511 Transcript_26786/m.64511 type:complete len:473 (+) Transcript_26786:299-1717(+)
MLLVEVPVLVSHGVAEHPEDLQGGDVITLGPLQLQVGAGVIALGQLQAPPVKIRPAENRGLAPGALRAVMGARLLRGRLGLQALLAAAGHAACLAAGAAARGALAPLAGDPFASRVLLADRGGLRLLPVAVGVVSTAAAHRALLLAGAAGGGAHPPGVADPAGAAGLGLALGGHHLPLRHGGHRGLFRIVTLRGLLADHLALRLGALLGLLALELADRIRAERFARQRSIADKSALRLLAPGVALRALAIQRLPTLADVLRAEHLALRLVAVHPALRELVGVCGLGAPGLALGPVAHGLTVLLADGLGAVPGAVGHAAQALRLGNQHPVLVERLPRGVAVHGPGLIHGDSRLLGHNGSLRRRRSLLSGHGVQVVRAVLRQRHRHPDVHELGIGVGRGIGGAVGLLLLVDVVSDHHVLRGHVGQGRGGAASQGGGAGHRGEHGKADSLHDGRKGGVVLRDAMKNGGPQSTAVG